MFALIAFIVSQDDRDKSSDRPDRPHHPHPLRLLPLHELVPGQGGHLQRAYRQVLPHIHGKYEMYETNKSIRIYILLRLSIDWPFIELQKYLMSQVSCCWWLPAQAVNFTFVPPHYRWVASIS